MFKGCPKIAANFGASTSGWERERRKGEGMIWGSQCDAQKPQSASWVVLCFCSGWCSAFCRRKHPQVSLLQPTLLSSQSWGFQLDLLENTQNWIKVLQRNLICKIRSKLNLYIWNSRNTADGGPDVPLCLAEDHTGSWHHLLKWTLSANYKQDPTEPLPTSPKSPKGWRGFGAAERADEFTLQLFLRFLVLLHHLLTSP